MKKNKGFTLVELLAVIAILAILVVVALPNVIKMYNEAKTKSFITEVKEIYKSAQSKWITESIGDQKETVYSKANNDVCAHSLDLSGGKKTNYYMKLNNDGKIIEYYAEDGTYQYTYNGPGLELKDIEYAVEISKLSDGEKVEISCTNASGGQAISGCKLIYGSLNNSGSEIVCGTEHFYVIRVVDNKVRMLAAKNITLSLTNPIQTTTHTPTFFSSTPYWYDLENNEIKSEYDKNGSYELNYVYDSNSNLYKYVEKYVDTIKGFGVNDVSGELIRLSDIYSVPRVSRRDGIKRSIIINQSEYNALKSQAISIFGDNDIDNIMNNYHLNRIWDYNQLNHDDKLVYAAMSYNLLNEEGLLSASDEVIIQAIDNIIDEMNSTYYDWLPEWMYDGNDYYSGEGRETNLAYPWKADWDGGASYDNTVYYSIRPVIIIPTSEIK